MRQWVEYPECPFCGGDLEKPFHKFTPWHLFMLFICQLWRMR